MFEFDLSKLILFGAVALVVIGPNELPSALRTAGRMISKIRRLKAEVRSAADTLMSDASLDKEFTDIGQTVRANLALNPMTAMRGSLPTSGAKLEGAKAGSETMEYASPEMRAYLAPPAEAAASGDGMTNGAETAPVC